MQLSSQLNKKKNEALNPPQIPNLLIADFVATFNNLDLPSCLVGSAIFKRFLNKYESLVKELEEFYENNAKIIDNFLLKRYFPETILIFKAQNYIVEAYIEQYIWQKLDSINFTSSFVPFRLNSLSIFDEKGNEIEKLDTEDDVNKKLIEMNTKHVLQLLNVQ